VTTIQIGVVFPQTELGGDAKSVRTYAVGVEHLGFKHLLAYDHVVGADPDVYRGWSGAYDVRTTFHEPLVLFGFLAAATNLELVSGVLVLPQRQTVLVAKQAAEIDLLCEGRLRLGVGVGWNAVEYEALGKEFRDRGRRLDEQIELLRSLWTRQSVTHHGENEQVTGAGLSPLPVQRPIPIWIGGSSAATYRRIGSLADGWIPMTAPGSRLDEGKHMIEDAAARAGRDPSTLGMEGRIRASPTERDRIVDHVGCWREAGASHLSVDTTGAGLHSVDDHLEALAVVADALRLGQTEGEE
jgi:probable F420-dependent oxidoreductase